MLIPLRASDPREIGPYRLLAELGRGGMGRVLLGSGPDGRLVAVKLVHEQFAEDDGFRARFRREVDASRAVSGAYTAAVVDADPDAPTPWLASVFVPGPSLHDAIETVGALPEESVLRLAAGLATALVHIHRAQLVHRDLKPSNVLLAEDGPRVIDFGIARAVKNETGSLTRTGWLVGSPAFMSPEQAKGETVTAAGDVFSLGCVVVAACTGASPFADTATLQTLNNVVHDDPDLAAIPDAIRRIVQPCLAKNPADRPAPAELLDSIGPIAPAARPWPAQVHEMIARGQAELAGHLDRSPPPTVSIEDGAPTVIAARGRVRTKVRLTEVLGPSAWKRRTVVAVVALLLAAAVVVPYVLAQGRGNATQQPSPASSSAAPSTTPSATPSPTPSVSATPPPTVRYTAIPDICAKVPSRAGTIIPEMDGGTEDTPPGTFSGLVSSHECRWSTEGYWSDHPWAADVYLTMFRFSSGYDGAKAFEKERTGDFYGNALRLHDFADELCLSNPTGKDYGYAHVMFRVDNLLVQVSYEMQTKGSPAPAVAKPRGLDMAKYVHGLVTAP